VALAKFGFSRAFQLDGLPTLKATRTFVGCHLELVRVQEVDARVIHDHGHGPSFSIIAVDNVEEERLEMFGSIVVRKLGYDMVVQSE